MTTAELAIRRHKNVIDFLSSRGLAPDRLTELMRKRVGPGELLLTSSPVHGLANATSDLDFIRIQDEELRGPRISTKIFEWGEHLEVVSFSVAEVRANLDELTRLASRPPAEIVTAFRSWDKRREPRRKQTERIVNGITLDGAMPYLGWLPALSKVWSQASLQNAVEQAAYLALAEAAGETRGRVGYAINTLLHLMDALLSYHGDVYTTRKWYLLRWVRLVRGGEWRDAPTEAAGRELERLRTQVTAALSSPARKLADDYLALVRATSEATSGTGWLSVRPEPVEGAKQYAFLPDAPMLLAPGSAVVLPSALPTAGDFGPLTFEQLCRIGGREAASLLRALRAGVVRLHVDYHEGANA